MTEEKNKLILENIEKFLSIYEEIYKKIHILSLELKTFNETELDFISSIDYRLKMYNKLIYLYDDILNIIEIEKEENKNEGDRVVISNCHKTSVLKHKYKMLKNYTKCIKLKLEQEE